jgi:hypothetical protein
LQKAATRVPLGDLWRGVCRAEDAPYTPDDSAVSELCNMGYARGRCPRYVQADAGDAVRFLIARDRDELIRIQYVVERDHHPYAHGALEYSRQLGAFSGSSATAVLARQALAFVTSYLRRRPVAA